MPDYCVAYNCNSIRGKVDKSISFHKFPFKNPVVLQKWVDEIRRKNWELSKNHRICSKHFTEDSFSPRPGAHHRLLKESAIPTIFDFPLRLQAKLKKRRDLAEKSHLLDRQCSKSDKEYYKNTSAPFSTPSVIQCENNATNNHEQSKKTKLTTTPIFIRAITNPAPQNLELKNGKQEISTTTQVDVNRDLLKLTEKIQKEEIHKQMQQKRIRALQAQLRRKDNRLSRMKNEISQLRRALKLKKNSEQLLLENFSGFSQQLLLNEINNRNAAPRGGERYSDDIKQFCLTLYLCSPKAYRYIRKQLVSLPHPQTINKWVKSAKNQPDLLNEALENVSIDIPSDHDSTDTSSALTDAS